MLGVLDPTGTGRGRSTRRSGASWCGSSSGATPRIPKTWRTTSSTAWPAGWPRENTSRRPTHPPTSWAWPGTSCGSPGRGAALEPLTEEDAARLAGDPQADDEESARQEAWASCLERCLERLPVESQELVLLDHQDQQRARIDGRRELARRLGIGLNALRIRVFRAAGRPGDLRAGVREPPGGREIDAGARPHPVGRTRTWDNTRRPRAPDPLPAGRAPPADEEALEAWYFADDEAFAPFRWWRT